MTKLKTLKDFTDKDCFVKFYPARVDEKFRKQRFIEENQLKKNAVKWIKKLEQGDVVELNNKFGLENLEEEQIIFLIKHLFNIQEKDLL